MFGVMYGRFGSDLYLEQEKVQSGRIGPQINRYVYHISIETFIKLLFISFLILRNYS